MFRPLKRPFFISKKKGIRKKHYLVCEWGVILEENNDVLVLVEGWEGEVGLVRGQDLQVDEPRG